MDPPPQRDAGRATTEPGRSRRFLTES